MPTIANLTVKKHDGVTDIVYTAIKGAGADGTNALWRCLAIGTSIIARPWASLMSKWNARKDVRQSVYEYEYPYVVTEGGIEVRKATVSLRVFAAVPIMIPDSIVNEAIAQGTNILASALLKQSIREGEAPT